MKSSYCHIVVLLLLTSIFSSISVSADNRSTSDITLLEPHALECVTDATYECVYPIDDSGQHSYSVPIVNGDSAGEYDIKMKIEDIDTGQDVYIDACDNCPLNLAAYEESRANWSNPYNSWYDGHTYNFTFYASLTNTIYIYTATIIFS